MAGDIELIENIRRRCVSLARSAAQQDPFGEVDTDTDGRFKIADVLWLCDFAEKYFKINDEVVKLRRNQSNLYQGINLIKEWWKVQ